LKECLKVVDTRRDAADALVKVAEEVNKSGNKDAGETFDAFQQRTTSDGAQEVFPE
jgi:hypothetical protein